MRLWRAAASVALLSRIVFFIHPLPLHFFYECLERGFSWQFTTGSLLHISLQLFVHPFLGVKKDSCESLFSMILISFRKKSKTFSVSSSHAWYSAAERPRRLGLNYLSLSAMASFSSLVWACVFAVHCCSSRNVNALPPPAQGVPLTSIAFGSCNKEWMDTDANLWVSVIKSAPNVWVWLGDAICESCYVDCIFRFHAWRCLHLHTPLCAAGEKESDH